MKRTHKIVFTDDKGSTLISIQNGKAGIECGYSSFDADRLEELASAASAAAEELRSLAHAELAS